MTEIVRSPLAQDLHEILLLRRPDANAAELPALRDLLDEFPDTYEGLVAIIQRAANQLGTLDQQAADRLFFADDRFSSTLGQRQSSAAELYGNYSSASWTKRVNGRPSPHDELLERLAERLRTDASHQSEPHNRPRRTRHRPSVAAVAVVGAVVIAASVVAVVALDRSESSDAESETLPRPAEAASEEPTERQEADELVTDTDADTDDPIPERLPTGCSILPGLVSGDLTTQQLELAALARPVFAEASQLGCADGPITPFGSAIAQRFVSDGEFLGVVFAAPNGVPLWLTAPQWNTYREVAGRGREATAREQAGLPISVSESDGVSFVELSFGGVLVGRTADAPHFWVLPNYDVRSIWEEMGGPSSELGLPTSNPFPATTEAQALDWYDNAWYLEFENGYMTLPWTLDQERPDVVIVDDPRAPLELPDLRGKVVSQHGDQAWLIDANGVARWIPDGETWFCLDGGERLVQTFVPGYTIASFSPGSNATCDSPVEP